MKTNWKHQKDAITTDQKFRNEDEHLHELDKRRLKLSKEDPELIPKSGKRARSDGAATRGAKSSRERP